MRTLLASYSFPLASNKSLSIQYPKIKLPLSFLCVGIPRFELGTPCSQSRCANRTALHPDICFSVTMCKSNTFFLHHKNNTDISTSLHRYHQTTTDL